MMMMTKEKKNKGENTKLFNSITVSVIINSFKVEIPNCKISAEQF